ncbi:glycosyltransferase [Deinococcus cavernae]|nr:glycosyltransferase [Deinococcus cavernae]
MKPVHHQLRVLHVVGSMNHGGVETWLMNLLRNVRRDEIAFDFLVHSQQEAAYDAELTRLGAARYVSRWPDQPLRYAWTLYRTLRRHGPYDAVHSHVHHFSALVLLMARLAGVPRRIAHSHSDITTARKNASFLRRLYLRITEWLLGLTATSGLAVSETSAEALFGPTWRRNKKWKVMYSGIDLSGYPTPTNRAALRARRRTDLGIPQDTFVIGHVGRFHPVKNHAFLIRIFRELLAREPKAYLVMVGAGPLRDQIEAQISTWGLQGSVSVLSGLDDVGVALQCMDVYVMPSVYEGLPISCLEAQATGLPILTSDTISSEVFVEFDPRYQLSLQDSVGTWVNRILEIRNHDILAERRTMHGSRFDAQVNLQQLKAEYA